MRGDEGARDDGTCRSRDPLQGRHAMLLLVVVNDRPVGHTVAWRIDASGCGRTPGGTADGTTCRARPQRLAVSRIRGGRCRGLAGLSVNAVVDTAGMAKGSFYNHFPTRRDYLVALHRDYHERLNADVAEAIGDMAPAQRGCARASRPSSTDAGAHAGPKRCWRSHAPTPTCCPRFRRATTTPPPLMTPTWPNSAGPTRAQSPYSPSQ